MIISPPFLKDREPGESDKIWLEKVMASDLKRGFPVSVLGSWHGGIHIKHTDHSADVERVRAIADGTVMSLRKASGPAKRDLAPLNLDADKPKTKGSDDGYVLLKHETEIGSGDNGKVVFWSLYMHLKSVEPTVKVGEKIWRKDPLGTSGMVDGVNAFHFQIFCDDENIDKLVGRKTQKLDITSDGRTDAVYGDIHFYLPTGTPFYDKAPAHNSTVTASLHKVYSSQSPLYVSMTLEKGACTMITRQENTGTEGKFDVIGDALVNADGEDYEYNLYKTAMANYSQSPSAGYELLRFGRIINTEHETLVPASAPLWMTVNYPGGKGVVNLADTQIKKFSDADFPHWTGWQLVDDDKDTDSQCNSGIIKKFKDDGVYTDVKDRLICHFPFEWDKSTFDTRFSWLKTGNEEHDPMKETDYAKFQAHAEALLFDTDGLPSGGLWHFHPTEFIEHLRKCGWLSHDELSSLLPRKYYEGYPGRAVIVTIPWATSFGRWDKYSIDFNKICNKYNILSPSRRASFLGQVYIETGMLRTMTEGGKGSKNSKGHFVSEAAEFYQPFYGRGFMQLTWPQNFDDYRKFRTTNFLPDVSNGYVYEDSRITNISTHYWADPRKKVTDEHTKKKTVSIDDSLLKVWYPRYDPKIIADDTYCSTDSAGFYWVSKHHSHVLNINRVADQGLSTETIGRCSVLVNGGGFGYFERQAYTRFSYFYLNDNVLNSLIETVSVRKSVEEVDIKINYTRQCR
ncbi:M23 family peptidase [Enterobacter cloacae complex sp. ESBL7]|uniref:M23 family peptidase n=1 Tax=Enterobacter cloacae complex sp. ESBL7 TaxID=3163325 RepID=UPI003562FBCF